jgi:uncharacterized membrane protein
VSYCWRLVNMGWLLVIAFLPFPTAMIGNDLNPVTGPIYIATLLLLSVLTLTMTVIVYRAVGAPIGLSWLTATVLAHSFLISLVNPQLGLCSLLLLIVAGRLEARHADRSSRAVE